MVASKRDNLCMQILRAKYKVDHSWLRSDPPKSASPVWKAIDKAKSIIIKGACYTIGDGASIDVWQDPWVKDLFLNQRTHPLHYPPSKFHSSLTPISIVVNPKSYISCLSL
nr:hypothetical protein CFP56_72651 [Quercus suber]